MQTFSKYQIRIYLDRDWLPERVDEYVNELFHNKDRITLEDLVLHSFLDNNIAVAWKKDLLNKE